MKPQDQIVLDTDVVILRGIPGSGKSTLFQQLKHKDTLCVSADGYFTNSGVYKFDPMKLGEAHAWCFDTYVDFIRGQGRGFVECGMVVDNTNIHAWEISPYVLMAATRKLSVKIVTLLVDPVIAATRNVHGVPAKAIERMHRDLTNEKLPPFWQHQVIEAGVSKE